MDSTKAAYEPVSTEEESVVAENAADTAPIVETSPIVDDTPPEVAEKNEKNAEKSAEDADKTDATVVVEEEKKEEDTAEQNGNVSLDLDSSIVPLKEAEEVPHADGEPHANGKANGKNGSVSIEMNGEEMEMEEGGDLKTKKSTIHCPKCPECPKLPAWRPKKWTPAAPKGLSSCSEKEEKEKQAEEGNVVAVEGSASVHAERYRWIAAVSFLSMALLVVILVFALLPRQEDQRIPAHHHQKADLRLHLDCDCPDNDLAFPTASTNGTAAAVSTTELTTLTACSEACVEAAECVAAVFTEESKSCGLKTLCEKMTKSAGKLLVYKS